ncbi:tigger transposable element-derived protein 4-like [Penaeus indicus]|uniref:tigger transposable element-derived protein 4-like n=1 Tax=Penaeus indicus TaxID=29960 RepID=UPI00300CA93A
MSVKKRVYNELTISKKFELVNNAENKTQRQLSKDFGVSLGTVSNLLKRKREIEELYEENVSKERCRKLRKTEHEQVNELMWDFFRECRRKNLPLSGPILQAQALEYAKRVNNNDFKASIWWLESFKTQHFQQRNLWCFKNIDVSRLPTHCYQIVQVKVIIFPPNTTSKLQPMDQGVIKPMKAVYRKLLLRALSLKLEDCDSVTEIIREVSVLDAVNLIYDAWRQLPPVTIEKCCRKAGFTTDMDSDEGEDDLIKRASTQLGPEPVLDAEEFVDADDLLQTCETLNDPNWKDKLLEQQESSNEHDLFDDGDDARGITVDVEEEPKSSKEASEMLNKLLRYALIREPGLLENLQKVKSDHDTARLQKLFEKQKQMTIEHFFSKN